MSKETKDTLIEVRKAYRFLYQYQRKILDLMDFIGKSYGLNYNGGSVRYSNVSPRNGSGKLNNWAWDWLNMYFYEFNFKNYNNKPIFSILLVNDTGSFISNKKDKSNSRTRLSSFEEVEKSETKLIFYYCSNQWIDFWLNWETNDFVLDEKGAKITEIGNKFIFKSYLLEDFENEEKALLKMKDFEIYCLENEINFKVIENRLKK